MFDPALTLMAIPGVSNAFFTGFEGCARIGGVSLNFKKFAASEI
jgi:hypothetical protein